MSLKFSGLLFRRRGRLNSRGVALRERALRGRAHSLRVEYFRRYPQGTHSETRFPAKMD